MIARNCSIKDLEQALKDTNVSYDNNVTWNRKPEKVGTGFRFTLRVKDSKKPGHRLAQSSGNRMVSACWHVHGDFFDNLLSENPAAVVLTGAKGHRIYADGVDKNGDPEVIGNWKDYQIGSMANPLMFSEACECGM
jgi:hypothetical protein